MVNGKWLSDFIERLKALAWHQLYYTAPTIYPCQIRVPTSNADSLKLQLLNTRKTEWWPATADSLPQAVNCETQCVSEDRTHNLPIVSPTPTRYQLCYRDHQENKA